MRSIAHVSALVISVALASCATNPPVSCPPPSTGTTQALMLRTDPAGASCSVLRGDVVVAAVAVTPDFATVPRRNEPAELVCQKGSLEHRRTLAAVPAGEVGEARGSPRECAKREPSAGELAGGFAAEVAFQGLVAFFPPAAIGIIAVGAVAAATAETRYAYRQPPELVLAPATFASEPACDAHFAALKARLEAEAGGQRTRINESCRPWPCNASDAVCPSPVCADQRARVDAELASRLDQLPELRARARIVPP
jgi:hypothetical protein